MTLDIYDVDNASTLTIDNTGNQGVDVMIGADGGSGSIALYSEQGTPDYNIKFVPSGSMTESSVYTWPVAKPGSAQYLQSDASGVLSWAASSGAFIDDPGASTQYNIVTWAAATGDTVYSDSGVDIDSGK
jgi:hypothetical protein